MAFVTAATSPQDLQYGGCRCYKFSYSTVMQQSSTKSSMRDLTDCRPPLVSTKPGSALGAKTDSGFTVPANTLSYPGLLHVIGPGCNCVSHLQHQPTPRAPPVHHGSWSPRSHGACANPCFRWQRPLGNLQLLPPQNSQWIQRLSSKPQRRDSEQQLPLGSKPARPPSPTIASMSTKPQRVATQPGRFCSTHAPPRWCTANSQPQTLSPKCCGTQRRGCQRHTCPQKDQNS